MEPEIVLYEDGFTIVRAGSRFELQVLRPDGRIAVSRMHQSLEEAVTDLRRRQLEPQHVALPPIPPAAKTPAKKSPSKPKKKRPKTANSSTERNFGPPAVLEECGPVALIRRQFGGYCTCLMDARGDRRHVRDFQTQHFARVDFADRSSIGEHILRRGHASILWYTVTPYGANKLVTFCVDLFREDGTIVTHQCGADLDMAQGLFDRQEEANPSPESKPHSAGTLPPQIVKGTRGGLTHKVLSVVGSVGNRISHQEVADAEKKKRELSGPVRTRQIVESDPDLRK